MRPIVWRVTKVYRNGHTKLLAVATLTKKAISFSLSFPIFIFAKRGELVEVVYFLFQFARIALEKREREDKCKKKRKVYELQQQQNIVCSI